jgi:NAD-dependent deacetylase
MAKVLILSGAGISAESGISTFRDSGGLWVITQNVDNLFEKAGLKSEDVIHLHGFLTSSSSAQAAMS